MSWRLILPLQVQQEIQAAAAWYEAEQEALGTRFQEEILRVLRSIEGNPFLNSRRDAKRHLRWRNARPFSYRVVYEIDEDRRSVVVLAIQHTSRDDRSPRGPDRL